MCSIILILSICLTIGQTIGVNDNETIGFYSLSPNQTQNQTNESLSLNSSRFGFFDGLQTDPALNINLNVSVTSLIVIILIIGVCVGFVLGGGCGICLGMAVVVNQPSSPDQRVSRSESSDLRPEYRCRRHRSQESHKRKPSVNPSDDKRRSDSRDRSQDKNREPLQRESSGVRTTDCTEDQRLSVNQALMQSLDPFGRIDSNEIYSKIYSDSIREDLKKRSKDSPHPFASKTNSLKLKADPTFDPKTKS